MAIEKVKSEDLNQCVDILFVPEIGQMYFPKKEMLREELKKNIVSDCVYAEKSADGNTIQGVIWYQREGLFHSFPYLHMIAVRGDCRHRGVGKRLMDFFEQDSLQGGKNKMRTKVFLLVSDLNCAAQKFYLYRGYKEMGRLGSLFRKGITEKLFMKNVTDNGREF